MTGVSLALLLYDYLRYRLILYLKRWSPLARLPKPAFFSRQPTPSPQTTPSARRPPKPAWVRREVIRLKALMPHDGCRKVAGTFNRLHAHKQDMRVGKAYVSQTLKRYRYEIGVLRRKIKNRTPRPLPKI